MSEQCNFDHFFSVCEKIIDSSLSVSQHEEEQSNFNAFFNVCDNIISESLNSNNSSNDYIQSGSGYKEDTPLRFKIISDYEKHTKQFNLTGRKIKFLMNDPPEGKNAVIWFQDSLQDVLEYILNKSNASDYVGLMFFTPRLENGPAWLSFRRADQLHMDVVWDTLLNILQSNKEVFTDGQFTIEMTKVEMPSGSGKIRGHGLSYAELCRRKNGIIEINNTDNLCLPRALIVAVSLISKDPCFKYIVQNTHGIQTERVRELMIASEIYISEDGAGLPEISDFQRYYSKYNICVYEHNGRGNVIFEGKKDTNLPRINLLYHQNHFSVIRSLTATFSCKYFCEQCHVPYNIRIGHSCEYVCPYCKQSPACIPTPQLSKCTECNRDFRGGQCFENHKKIVCNKLKKCEKCLKLHKCFGKKQHVCGEVYCKMCEGYKNPGHLCYILRDETKLKGNSLFLYYDFETRQEKDNGENKEHEVNLCVVQQSCSTCSNITDIKQLCNSCGIRQHIFKNEPLKNFLSYVLLPRTTFSSVTCIAHNSKAFDCQFILKYLVEQYNVKPKLILNGTKIMLLEINHIRFIDSLNYLPMALSSLPKAMDLPSSIKKGYFPHLFNTLNNRNYTGQLPDPEYYGINMMSVSVRQKFLEWYKEQIQNNYIFNMEHEIVAYCVADVDILRRACIKFRDTFIQDCKVCPFTEAVTIASACNRVFRRLFIKPNTIGIIPSRGYRMKDNQSKIAIKWLIHQEKIRGIRIQHAAYGEEAIVDNYLKVDGYYATEKLVFEFLGCFWHGCIKCYKTNRDKKVYNTSKETLENRYEKTISKLTKIQNLGYTVISIWECEFKKELLHNKKLKSELDSHELLNNLPLNPRDAFFGGRTGNTCLYKKAEMNEKIKYVDVCSLYPYVCKYGKYPTGHPEIFVGDQCNLLCPDNNIDQVEGIIKCTILPPTNLFHPVLPRKAHGKLMFVLCRTCCDKMEQGDCLHSISERQFMGTWVVDEVRRAVSLGYKIMKVHEIWQYKVTVYDSKTKTGGLFAEYVDTFLKIKQEASGYPEECIDDKTKAEYIKKYFLNEGVQLDPTLIEKNAGKRSNAKLMLNSFWGKFAQAENRPSTSVVASAGELYDLLANPSISVNRVITAGDQMLYVHWVHEEEAMQQLRTVNVVIAAYTTAQARLRLHEFLVPLDRKVLYYDTDSIIYYHSPGEYEPPTGNFLGDLTNELTCYGDGSYITEFVCGGPKNYAYRVYSPLSNKINEVCKVKGFTLNYKNSQSINFECLKNLVFNRDKNGPIIYSENIRCTQEHNVITKKESKAFNIRFTKRKLVNNLYSVPYGERKRVHYNN